jgi:NADP-dependent 3-hydroxy acid dehydrogenase YdfG
VADERTCLITGASTGIGAAPTHTLLDAGWNVVGTSRSEERLAALADAADAGERLTVSVADAGDWADTQRVELCAERYGRIDAVVANAGYTLPGDFRQADVAQWPAMVATNVLGSAYLLRMMFAPLGVGVALVSPGVVDTEFYAAGTPEVHLTAADLATVVRSVLESPADVELNTVVVRPRRQLI